MGLALSLVGSAVALVFGSIAGFLFEQLGHWWLDGYTWLMGLAVSIALVLGSFESLGALGDKGRRRGAMGEVVHIPIGILVGIPVALMVGNLFFSVLFSLQAIGSSIRSLPITQSEWFAISLWNLVFFVGGALLSFLAGIFVTVMVAWPIEGIYERMRGTSEK